MSSFLRSLVSESRVRFEEDGFNLDLTYITDQIIAMGLPSTGVQATFRNRLSDVARLLKKNHKGHFMIWNLSEKSYDYSQLDNAVLELGWPDHHSPTLGLLLQACQSIGSWLSADANNVAVVHCKAGKGRTGCVIASYLIYSGVCLTAEEAILFFAKRRSRDPSTVLRGASQRRYVHYLAEILGGFEPSPRSMILRRVICSGVPAVGGKGGCRPIIELYLNNTEFLASSRNDPKETVPSFTRHDGDIMNISFDFGSPVLVGDILIHFQHFSTSNSKLVPLGRYAFHTGFISDGVVRVTKDDLDAASDRLPNEFFMDLFFESEKRQTPRSQKLNDMKDTSRPWPWKHIVEVRQRVKDPEFKKFGRISKSNSQK